MRQTYGSHDVDADGIQNSGHIGHDPVKLQSFDQRSQWVTTDFRAGDVVVLTMHTIHSSLHNVSPNRLRLSCDVRFQPASEPFDERWVEGEDGTPAGHLRGSAWHADGGKPPRTREEALRGWGLAAAL